MSLSPITLVWLALGTAMLSAAAWLLVSRATAASRAAVSNLYSRTPRAVTVVEAPVPTLTVSHEGLLSRLARRLTLASLVARLERKHIRAGRPAWSVGRILTIKTLWVPVILAASFLVTLLLGSPVALLGGLVLAVLGYFYPDARLESMAQARADTIQRELADTLDQMTIVVSAGEGFDSAMAHAARTGTGVLAQELTRTLQDVQMGQTRRQALEGLVARTDVKDLRVFVRTILAAERQGIALEKVLKAQAADIRRARRERAEEKAQKVGVKLTFPTVFLMLPAVAIPLLIPIVIGILEM